MKGSLMVNYYKCDVTKIVMPDVDGSLTFSIGEANSSTIYVAGFPVEGHWKICSQAFTVPCPVCGTWRSFHFKVEEK